MGLGDTMTSALFLNRRKSDVEFKIQAILTRKMAIMDECNEISEILATTIFQNDEYNSISQAAILPGTVPTSPVVPLGAAVAIPTGYYETELARLQGVEKELDNDQTKLEVELEGVKAEQESMQKLASEHAKNDFKIGG